MTIASAVHVSGCVYIGGIFFVDESRELYYWNEIVHYILLNQLVVYLEENLIISTEINWLNTLMGIILKKY